MNELIVTLVLAIHLASMNLASAGPLCFLWIKDAEGAENHLRLRVVRWSVAAFLLGMITGVLLWLIMPGDGLTRALGRFPVRAFGYAAAELVFSMLCLLPVAMDWKFLRGRAWLGKLLALLSVTNLLYHFPPLMAIIGQLAANPHWSSAPLLDRPAVLTLMTEGHVLALSFHFGLASITLAAITSLFLISEKKLSEELLLPLRKTVRRTGFLALVATLLQIPVGIWLLASTPVATRTALMGSSLASSLAFVAALTGTLLLLQRLLSIALGDCERKTLRSVSWLLLVIIVLMTGTLRWSRPNVVKGAERTISATSISAALHLR